ncbi:TPA: hypothetical protein HA241_02065 [Candidatus Woesearchaeota archaeon]|nr:hypothetical protein [Candidatus Woesearchaeota archaeon]
MDYYKTWKEIIFEPTKFFSEITKEKWYREPILFAAYTEAIYLASLIVLGSIVLLIMNAPPSYYLAMLGFFPIGLGLFIGLLYLWALVLHLFVLIFKGKEGFNQTFKVVSYSSAPSVFSGIPLISSAVPIYTIVLQVIGLQLQQKLTQGKSIAAVLLPTGIIFFLIFVIAFVIAILIPTTY